MFKGGTLVVVIVWSFVLGGIQIDQIEAQEKLELDYVTGELLVRFAPTRRGQQIDTNSKNAILNSLGGGALKHDFIFVPGLSLIKLPENQKVEDVLSAFNADEGILYAEPNFRLKYQNNYPNDPCFVHQWGLHNWGQTGGDPNADIDAPEAWDIRRNADPNVIVAVIDSGVDYNHVDLADNMLGK